MSSVIYPIFEECVKFTLDSYWKDIFHKCACNKFPRGATYNDSLSTLYIRSTRGKAKRERINIDKTNPPRVFNTLMTAFKENLNLYSKNDLRIKKTSFAKGECMDKVLDCEWKKIKPSSLKDHILMKFVLKKKKEHDLSDDEAREFYRKLQRSIKLTKISSKDIEYEKGEILSISGLKYDEKTRTFIVLNRCSRTHSSKEDSSNSEMCQAIDRFVRAYRAQMISL